MSLVRKKSLTTAHAGCQEKCRFFRKGSATAGSALRRTKRRSKAFGQVMGQVKYRSYTPGLNPRRTKLEVPGWGGQREPRRDGSAVLRRSALRHRTLLPQ